MWEGKCVSVKGMCVKVRYTMFEGHVLGDV